MDASVSRKRPRGNDPLARSGETRDSSISPPPRRNAPRNSSEICAETINLAGDDPQSNSADKKRPPAAEPLSKIVPSPIQLNFVKDLPTSNNVDTVKLSDILGDPMIKECWLFNYLFDIDFIMSQFDSDVRDLIHIRVVHGSWKAEDRNGIGIIDGARRYPNIQVIKAYMAEAYGTHHSKMIVLFRHDDLAQVIILTGNFIERDWSMSQAIWRSPLLPLTKGQPSSSPSLTLLGSGTRFKHDLLAYFRGYGPEKLRDLVNDLQQYDFSKVRGALVASVPGKQNIQSMDPEFESLWGWPALKRILSCISPTIPNTSATRLQSHIIAQVSSVAAVGEKWLKDTFIPTLSTTQKAIGSQAKASPSPKTSLVFPTSDEIRRCVDGYSAGASIHMKISSATQTKQLHILRPMLCHWAGDQKPSKVSFFGGESSIREAGRRRAAPHIKTYVRFHDAATMDKIDWAMVTSANLSTQAWGGAMNPSGEVRICSYEIGVVVWPALWDANDKPGNTEMAPVFKRDMPAPKDPKEDEGEGDEIETVVGFRMPYDLPLVPYTKDEMPWSAELPYVEPDWKGQTWPGYER